MALRQQFPLIGIEYSPNHLERASFKALKNNQEAKEWLKLTMQIVTLSSSDSVNNFAKRIAQTPLNTPNRVCKTYLTLGPGKRQAGIVLHTSHALTGQIGRAHV